MGAVRRSADPRLAGSGRVGRAALAALGCAALLAGCSSTVAGQAFPADYGPPKPTVPAAGLTGVDPAASPVVGTCYQVADGQQETPLDPPPPVACSGEHNAETAVVGDTGLGPEEPRPSEDEVLDPGTTLGAAVQQLCDLDDVVAYLGGEEIEDPYAFYAVFLPGEEQWAAGARWMRCDVYYGYYTPQASPGVLSGALAGPDAAAYRTCFVGSATDFLVTPCSDPHDAEPAGFRLADLPTDAPYPDEATRRSLAASCQRAVEEYVRGPTPLGYVIDVWVDTEEEWAMRPDARCALVPAGGGQTSGSLRP